MGVASDSKGSRRVFLRNGVKVAALITVTISIGPMPPQTHKFIQFYIDADNWIEINLADPRRFYAHFVAEVNVNASDDSVVVTAPKKGYCEIFYKSNGTFMDGELREQSAPGFMAGEMLPR